MQFHKPLKYLLSLGKSFLTFILMFLFKCRFLDNNKVPGAKNEIDAVKTEVKTPE